MKKSIFFGVLSLVFICALWKCSVPDRDLVKIPMFFSKKLFPLVQVDIAGKEYPFELTLTSKYPMYISHKILEKIQKSEKGEATWKNAEGKEKHASLFEIPNVKIETLKLKNVKAVNRSLEGCSQESKGAIAWPLDRMNLLLDLSHHAIWGIKNPKSLKWVGFDLEKMEKVKYDINTGGIHFKIETDLGELTMALATSCNMNAIHPSKQKNKQASLFTRIKIGNMDFGIIKFTPIEFTEELEVDGFLGVQFLLNHAVYIDAQNRFLYFGEKYGNTIEQKSATKIPIEFSVDGIPIAKVHIGQNAHNAIIDLGYPYELSLHIIITI